MAQAGRGPLALAVLAVSIASCDGRGCANLLGRAAGTGALAPTGKDLPVSGIDCPDGLARCEEGVISVSRLATIALPCHGPPESCRCPWDRLSDCAGACAADGVEVVIERDAAAQLCAPRGAQAFALPAAAPFPSASPCEEGDRYECSGGAIVECASNSIVAQCLRGCRGEGGAVDDDRVSRVAAFAILCSR